MRINSELSQISDLNPRGRTETERRLREIYASGDDDIRAEAARFLCTWQSGRRLAVADDWLAEGTSPRSFRWIAVCFGLCSLTQTYDRFIALISRSDLLDDNVDALIDSFSDLVQGLRRDPRYTEALKIIAAHLKHRSPEVRWTAAFSLGKLKASPHREELVALTRDQTNTAYGYVSRVAKNAVLVIDGDPDVDLHDASIP